MLSETRFLGGAAQRGPLAADELGEAEPGQGVEDRHAGSVLAGAGDHRGEAAVVRLVVAQVQGGVAEVGEQVEVGDCRRPRRSPVRRAATPGRPPSLGGCVREAEQEVAEAAGRGRVVGDAATARAVGVEGGAAVEP